MAKKSSKSAKPVAPKPAKARKTKKRSKWSIMLVVACVCLIVLFILKVNSGHHDLFELQRYLKVGDERHKAETTASGAAKDTTLPRVEEKQMDSLGKRDRADLQEMLDNVVK